MVENRYRCIFVNSSVPLLGAPRVSSTIISSPRVDPVTQDSYRLKSLPASLIQDQLQRILASKPFAQSVRMSRFLRFTVEHALSGESDQLKEYVLGVEVFDPNRPTIREWIRSCASRRDACVLSSRA